MSNNTTNNNPFNQLLSKMIELERETNLLSKRIYELNQINIDKHNNYKEILLKADAANSANNDLELYLHRVRIETNCLESTQENLKSIDSKLNEEIENNRKALRNLSNEKDDLFIEFDKIYQEFIATNDLEGNNFKARLDDLKSKKIAELVDEQTKLEQKNQQLKLAAEKQNQIEKLKMRLEELRCQESELEKQLQKLKCNNDDCDDDTELLEIDAQIDNVQKMIEELDNEGNEEALTSLKQKFFFMERMWHQKLQDLN